MNLLRRLRDGLKGWFARLGWPGLAAALFGIVLAGAIYARLAFRADDEMEKGRLVAIEVTKLDKEIAEIRSLRDQIMMVLARKQIIEVVHKDRFLAARLFDQLARQRPRGVYLTSVREEGARVYIAGFAASYKEVAGFITNLDTSPVLERPQLMEVKAESAARYPDFPIRFSVNAAIRGKKPAPQTASARVWTDVNPGDPK